MNTPLPGLIGTDTTSTYRYPFPPFPNGWFPIELSNKLKPGDVVDKHMLGRDLVIYRTESGKANVIGAYCPHLGAHIGKGGQVVGEHIRCPFHHWQFGMDGRCARAAGTNRIPSGKVETYPVEEKNGAIFIWVDHLGRAPSWEIPLLWETIADDYRFVGHAEYIIRTHPQEMFENQPDFLHFLTVHGWNPADVQWTCNYDERHTTLTFGVENNATHIATTTDIDRLHITSLGPSYNFTRFSGKFGALAILMFCPTEAGVMYSPLLFWVHESIPVAAGESWMQGYLKDYVGDIDILENKRYVSRPRMSDADGPIHRMRRWYQQWYE